MLDNLDSVEYLAHEGFNFFRHKSDDLPTKQLVDLTFEVHERVSGLLLDLSLPKLVKFFQIRLGEEEWVLSVGLLEESKLKCSQYETEVILVDSGHGHLTQKLKITCIRFKCHVRVRLPGKVPQFDEHWFQLMDQLALL